MSIELTGFGFVYYGIVVFLSIYTVYRLIRIPFDKPINKEEKRK